VRLLTKRPGVASRSTRWFSRKVGQHLLSVTRVRDLDFAHVVTAFGADSHFAVFDVLGPDRQSSDVSCFIMNREHLHPILLCGLFRNRLTREVQC
jgi:hypothetical protein